MRYKQYEIIEMCEKHYMAKEDGSIIGHATSISAILQLVCLKEKQKGVDKFLTMGDFAK